MAHDPVRLHGIAAAAVYKKNDPKTLQVVCTPIAVSETMPPGSFDILKDLTYTDEMEYHHRVCRKEQKVVFRDTEQVREGFIYFVDTLRQVHALQQESAKAAGIEPRPVALYVGVDNRNPIDSRSTLYPMLFGELYRNSDSYPFRRISPTELQHTLDGLKEQAVQDTAYMAACEDLIRLLPECTLKWGEYGFPPHSQEHEDYEYYTADKLPALARAPYFLELKERLKDPDWEYFVLEELKGFAREFGKNYGHIISTNPEGFQITPMKGFGSEETRKKFPDLDIYRWHPEIEAAFYESYREHYWGPHNRHLKLPDAKKNPFFTDTCADMVRDEIEIAKNMRVPGATRDNPRSRLALIRAASELTNSALRQ